MGAGYQDYVLISGIVVYSAIENKSWKIRHDKSMRAEDTEAHFRVNGVDISAKINIAGIALGPKNNATGEREVFYSPISSLHLYSIQNTVLQSAKGVSQYQGDVRDVGRKISQSDGIIADNEGMLYFGLLGENSIARWNTSTDFASNQKVRSYLQDGCFREMEPIQKIRETFLDV